MGERQRGLIRFVIRKDEGTLVQTFQLGGNRECTNREAPITEKDLG